MEPTVQDAIKELLDQSSRNFTELLTKVQSPGLSAAILQIVPLEFSGGPDDDVYDWLGKFERITTGLSDSQIAVLLPKSFIKSARHWFKDELEPILGSLDWKGIKSAILDRFSGQNKEDRYFDRLANLAYDNFRQGSLSSYADEYIHIYRKAYPKAGEQEIVQAMVRAIPKQYKGRLGTVINLRSIATVKSPKETLKYYNQEVNIGRPEEKKSDLDMHKITELIANAVKTV